MRSPMRICSTTEGQSPVNVMIVPGNWRAFVHSGWSSISKFALLAHASLVGGDDHSVVQLGEVRFDPE